MNKNLKNSIKCVENKIVSTLKDNVLAIYVYGSIVLEDFKLGWSDIDLLVLTKNTIDEDVAKKLLTLRQEMLKEEPKNKYYRSFEGAILSLNGFLNQTKENVVYWGTKGEKIKENYKLDSFSMKEIIENGRLLHGEDVRIRFKTPTYEDLKNDIKYHYETIREHAQITGRNLYSFGWFLDISRCLYTLKFGEIISKTKAGNWALKNNLCPDKNALKFVLKVRKNPLKYKNEKQTMDYAETLGPSIQKYANLLETYF